MTARPKRQKPRRRAAPTVAADAPPRAGQAALVVAAPWMIGALALALRLYHLGREPLWFDEAYTALAVHRPMRGILQLLAGEGNAPLYYILLKEWTVLAGDGEYALRLLSAVIGAATIPLVYWVAMRMFSQRAGLIAAALAAVSPLQIHYSQEARMYALVPPVALVLLYTLYRLLVRPTAGMFVGFVLSAVGGLYLHYYFLFLLPLAAAALCVQERRRALVVTLAALCAVGVGFAPWLPTFLHQASGGVEDWIAEWWHGQPFWYAVPWSLETLGPGAQYPPMASFKFPSSLWARALSLGLAALIVGGAAIVLYHAGRSALAGAAARREQGEQSAAAASGRPALALVLSAVLVPLLIAFGVSAVRIPIYVVGRHDLIAWGPYYVLAGAVLARLKPSAAIGACTLWIALAVFTLVPYFTTDRPKRNYVDLGREIANTLTKDARVGETVIFTAGTRTTTAYYLRTAPDRLRLVSYPLDNDAHLGWIDPRIRADPQFGADAAAAFIQWLGNSNDLPAVLWVVGPQSRGTAPLLSHLEQLGYRADTARSTGALLCLRRG